ncbi:MAG TPA: RNA polymerase sigma factor [Candidatus Saccharimonadales bacterium]|jgi:RNA polymerase sigma-70 factor (ECF subfamily)|nr:RNA polymerase sigma factor [Candidatus Saccharimonadales bacterium]
MDQEQLVVALRRGDPLAVQELVDACGPRLLRSAFLLCGSETDAQDLVQETLIQALQSIHRFRGQSSIYTWLRAILLNLSRHYHRDRQRLVCDDELARKDIPAPDEGPARLDTEAASLALADALRQLSGVHRTVLVLRFYEEMKIHEIAAHLGLSKGSVKSRLHYAIAKMQRLLPGELNLFGATGTKEKEQE